MAHRLTETMRSKTSGNGGLMYTKDFRRNSWTNEWNQSLLVEGLFVLKEINNILPVWAMYVKDNFFFFYIISCAMNIYTISIAKFGAILPLKFELKNFLVIWYQGVKDHSLCLIELTKVTKNDLLWCLENGQEANAYFLAPTK